MKIKRFPDDNGPKPNFIKSRKALKDKVGDGGIEEELLAEGQSVIGENYMEFKPYAKESLTEITHILDDYQDKKFNQVAMLDAIIKPVMQLKANAGMFSFELASSVMGNLLNFLEVIEKIDKDAIKVIEAHQKTVNVIVASNLRGDGGEEGEALTKELEEACARYFDKRSAPTSE